MSSELKTVLEVINLATDFLTKKNVANAKREVLALLAFGLNLRPLDLYMQFDRPLNEVELDRFRNDLKRRSKGEPYQYICGEVEFFDCKFNVNSNVLIPRQETEILVDTIAQEIGKLDLQGCELWDVCCGSGCIGISLKKRFPALKVVLADLSEAALQAARENATLNAVEVEFLQGDFLHPFIGRKADFIVCNPPYVTEEEYHSLQEEVRGYEPRMALVAPENGLSFYKRLGNEVERYLKPEGRLWLELGHLQGQAVSHLFSHLNTSHAQLTKDWAGHDRFFTFQLDPVAN